jgi:hypothetical protein
LDVGAALGGRNVNTAGANALLQGGIGAAQTIQGAAGYSPTGGLLSGLGSTISQNIPSLTSLYNRYQQSQQNYTPSGYTPAAPYNPTIIDW